MYKERGGTYNRLYNNNTVCINDKTNIKYNNLKPQCHEIFDLFYFDQKLFRGPYEQGKTVPLTFDIYAQIFVKTNVYAVPMSA